MRGRTSVEAQCAPTRSAIPTGRLASHSGAYAVPLPGHGAYGLCPWKYAIAELMFMFALVVQALTEYKFRLVKYPNI